MRRLLLLSLIGLAPCLYAQPADSVYTFVSDPPQPLPNAETAFAALQQQVVYPTEALAAGIAGRVTTRCVIDPGGLPGGCTVARGLGFGLDEEALRLVALLRFSPPRHEGRAVYFQTYVPLDFVLPLPDTTATPTGPLPSALQARVDSLLATTPDTPGAPRFDTPPQILPNFEIAMQRATRFIQYPEAALKARVRGRVVVTFWVNEEGKVINPVIRRGVGFGLDEEVIRAVQTIEFRPAMLDGKPVKAAMTLPFSFNIRTETRVIGRN